MSGKRVQFEDYAAMFMAALVQKQEIHPELPNEELAATAVTLAEALAEELNKRRRHAEALAELLEHRRRLGEGPAEELKSRGAELNEPPVHPRCKCETCDVDECEDRNEPEGAVPPEPAELGPYPRLCPGCAKRSPRPCPYRSADLKLGREVCTAVGVKTFNPTGRCMDCPATHCLDCRRGRAEVHAVNEGAT